MRERGWCVSGAPIAITVNGEERRVPTGATVAQLLAELDLRPEAVAVEINRCLVRRADRELRRLESGDAVEIVTLVGGG